MDSGQPLRGFRNDSSLVDGLLTMGVLSFSQAPAVLFRFDGRCRFLYEIAKISHNRGLRACSSSQSTSEGLSPT
jgi:hypothetical protein